MTRRNTVALKKEMSSDELSTRVAKCHDLVEIFEQNFERGSTPQWGYIINELKYALGVEHGNSKERRR